MSKAWVSLAPVAKDSTALGLIRVQNCLTPMVHVISSNYFIEKAKAEKKSAWKHYPAYKVIIGHQNVAD